MGHKQISSAKKLLIIGPLPPPVGGGSLTVKALVDELVKRTSPQVIVINSAPSAAPMKSMIGFRLEKIWRFIKIITRFLKNIHKSDAVLVFSNELFVITIVPIMLFIARVSHKSLFIKPVGGDLDLLLEKQQPYVKKYFLKILNASDGIFAQTHLLQNELKRNGCRKIYYVPGFRTLTKPDNSTKIDSPVLRLIFLSHVSREKGPIILLDALKLLSKNKYLNVSCDFFGPVYDDIKNDFFSQLEVTNNAHYCGISRAGSSVELISRYDALVLPTYFKSEGHPGVIIEAMQAGVPVISTDHRSIPELITNGENGILVPIQDSTALAEAIHWAAENRQALKDMGQANNRRAHNYITEVVVSQMLDIIF